MKNKNKLDGVDKDVAAMINNLKEYDTLLEHRSLALRKPVQETLGKSAKAGEYISDFVHSDDPKFSGDSKEQRIKRALGAYYGEHPEKSRKEESIEEGKCDHCHCDPCECPEESMHEEHMEEGKCDRCHCDPCECPDHEIMEWMQRFNKLGKM